jgi:hypothetical protein
VPGIILPLKRKTPFCRRDKTPALCQDRLRNGPRAFRSNAQRPNGGSHHSTCRQAAAFTRLRHWLLSLLTLAFAKKKNLSIGCCSRPPRDSNENLLAMYAGIDKTLGCVKAQSIEMKISDPILRALKDKFADRFAVPSKLGASPHSVEVSTEGIWVYDLAPTVRPLRLIPRSGIGKWTFPIDEKFITISSPRRRNTLKVAVST